MGQAFDRDGHVLGEAYGETKREVFDKLTNDFKDAHEIRIRSVGPSDSGGASIEMPRYRCHKEVWALKIGAVVAHFTGGATLEPFDPGYAAIEVDDAYMRKHSPRVGGYYVVYKDGYTSFSPADAFEDGYTRV